MLRFSANLSTLFKEVPFPERPAAAAAAGFRCVEMQFLYDTTAKTLAADLERLSLEVSVINVPAGDLVEGGEGNAAIRDRQEDFRAGVEMCRRYADILRPRNVNVLAGAPAEARDKPDCLKVLAENLHYAGQALSGVSVGVVVEAINTVDRPGFLLSTPEDVMAAMDAADHANLSMEFDIYHMAMMRIPVVNAFRTHLDRIGHIQFADAPKRNEPGTGTVDFDAVFAAIRESEYDGWAAAEYFPKGTTEEGLGWHAEYA